MRLTGLAGLLVFALAAAPFSGAAFAQKTKAADRQRPQKRAPLPDAASEPDPAAEAADAAGGPNDDISAAADDDAYNPVNYQAAQKTFADLKIPDLTGNFKGCGFLFAVEAGDPAWEAVARSAIDRLPGRVPAETLLRSDNLSATQAAIDSLTARGAKKIVVIPLFLNSNSDSLTRFKVMLGLREKPFDADKSPGGSVSASAAQRADIKVPVSFAAAIDASPVYARAVARALKNFKRSRPTALLLVGSGLGGEADNRARLDIMNRVAAQAVTDFKCCAMAQAALLRPRGETRRTLGSADLKMDSASFSKGIYGADGRLTKDTDENSARQASAEQFKKTARKLGTQYSLAVAGYSLASRELDKLVETELDGVFYSWLGNVTLEESDVRAWLITKINEGMDLPAVTPARKRFGNFSSQDGYDKTLRQ